MMLGVFGSGKYNILEMRGILKEGLHGEMMEKRLCEELCGVCC